MGAAGYVTKTSAADVFTTAISSILRTGKYLSPTVSLLLAHEVDSSRSSHTKPHELLSNREMEVAGLIASGITAKEIAEQLSLSIKTINTHRSRLLAKLGLKNSIKLTAYFIQHHLI
jgi:DNA-binding NarL/FixJ family response regulator